MFNNLTFMQGLLIGLAIAVLEFLYYFVKFALQKHRFNKDMQKKNNMLADKMEIDSAGLAETKKTLEKIKKENENLRVTVQTLSQKPDKHQAEQLQVYQGAVEKLTMSSPGFPPAWQQALREAQADLEAAHRGEKPLLKKFFGSAVEVAAPSEERNLIGDGK